jgi:hypothetical protein
LPKGDLNREVIFNTGHFTIHLPGGRFESGDYFQQLTGLDSLAWADSNQENISNEWHLGSSSPSFLGRQIDLPALE